MKKVLLMFVIVSFSGLYAQMAADDESGRGIPAVSSTESQPEFDPEMIKKIRGQKEFREKLHVAQELENVEIQKPKTFRVSNSKSKFAPIKRLMNRLSSSRMNNAANLDRNVTTQKNKDSKTTRNNSTVEK